MNQDEQIATQQATSNNTENNINNSQQTLESSDQGKSDNVVEQTLIPEKFVGKSAIEIYQAYKELEKIVADWLLN